MAATQTKRPTFLARSAGQIIANAINTEAAILLRTGYKPEYIAKGFLEFTIEIIERMRNDKECLDVRYTVDKVVQEHREAYAQFQPPAHWFYPKALNDILERVVALAYFVAANPAGRFCTHAEHRRYHRDLDKLVQQLKDAV